MKLIFFKILLIGLITSNYSLALAVEYESSSSQDAQMRDVRAERKKNEDEVNQLIGKTFWYVPNPKVRRIAFYPTSPTNADMSENYKLEKEKFAPASETTFEIMGVENLYTSETTTIMDQIFFKVKFHDGKIGYTRSDTARNNNNTLQYHIYKKKNDGRDYYIEKEYVYTEPPEVIASREHEENEKAEQAKAKVAREAETKARAKWKAKGGVHIGMTKDQALASNWGKPNKVNNTTNANGTREQWVYRDGNYLYFDNGILTSIQH